METQDVKVLLYMKDNGSITSIEAFQYLGVTRLAAVISRLKTAGNSINSVTEVNMNIYGRKVHYSRYYLNV